MHPENTFCTFLGTAWHCTLYFPSLMLGITLSILGVCSLSVTCGGLHGSLPRLLWLHLDRFQPAEPFWILSLSRELRVITGSVLVLGILL